MNTSQKILISCAIFVNALVFSLAPANAELHCAKSMSAADCDAGILALMNIDDDAHPAPIKNRVDLANYRQSLEILRKAVENTRAKALDAWMKDKKSKAAANTYWVAMRNYNIGMGMYRRHWRRYKSTSEKFKSNRVASR